MASSIKIPDSEWHSQRITVGGRSIEVVFKYNPEDEAWYIDLLTLRGGKLLTGLKVMPNQNVTGRNNTRGDLPSGNLWCLRFKNNTGYVDKSNLGRDKTYRLVWLSPSEEERLAIDGRIQL